MPEPSEQGLSARSAPGTGPEAGSTDLHEKITEVLRTVIDPELGENIVDLAMVRSISVQDSHATIEVALTISGCPMRTQLEQETSRAALLVEGIESVEIVIGAMAKDERAALMNRARRLAQERSLSTDIPSNTRILGIMSGKGGVGKSSITANLAAALAQSGAVVGLLDADIWGFSIPRMLGVTGPLEVRDKKILPMQRLVGKGQLKVVSMGFLSGEDEAIMWRGLVLNRALQHFIEDVAWGELDYLLIDLPPGTGDVQMGLARMLPRTELLLVTTPGIAAQKVAGRAADMARKGNLRVAGVIENMSGFTCVHGEYYPLFGEGGGRRLADSIGVPLIAQIPIDSSVASGGDAGEPAVLNRDSAVAQSFRELSRLIQTEIAPVIDMGSCSARLLDQIDGALTGAS
ncbi:MAG TPA: P-loop NTPase [Acidimicrobiales bacterium]|nr:P-loop NTPase [Acidimicrobiales bacterium]